MIKISDEREEVDYKLVMGASVHFDLLPLRSKTALVTKGFRALDSVTGVSLKPLYGGSMGGGAW